MRFLRKNIPIFGRGRGLAALLIKNSGFYLVRDPSVLPWSQELKTRANWKSATTLAWRSPSMSSL